MSKQRDVEQHSRPPAGDDALERRSVIAVLAAAGIAGPVIFAVVALVQSLLRPHPEHGRVLQTYLTGEGERLRRECAKRVDAIVERMVSGLSEDERLRLLELLRWCSAALRQDD